MTSRCSTSRLFRIPAFAFGNVATLMSSLSRGGLQFMLIIWLQGIWLPLHGYDYSETPLWSAIYMVPLTVGFLGAAPVAGWLSDRFGARIFATGGLLVVAVTFGALLALPTDFIYWQFAVILFVSGIGAGLFASPNMTGVMNSLPADQRGAGSGMLSTLQNSGMALSIGVFFSTLIAGLATTMPAALFSGLTQQNVPANVATNVANLPPVGTLFAAFLGYNPMQKILGPQLLAQLPPGNAATVVGKQFFPQTGRRFIPPRTGHRVLHSDRGLAYRRDSVPVPRPPLRPQRNPTRRLVVNSAGATFSATKMSVLSSSRRRTHDFLREL